MSHFNEKFVHQLRQDEDMLADFMHSKYAINGKNVLVREDKQLKDIIQFVQTAMVRLYIENNDKAGLKVFFAKFRDSSQLYLLPQEIESFYNDPELKMNEATKKEFLIDSLL